MNNFDELTAAGTAPIPMLEVINHKIINSGINNFRQTLITDGNWRIYIIYLRIHDYAPNSVNAILEITYNKNQSGFVEMHIREESCATIPLYCSVNLS